MNKPRKQRKSATDGPRGGWRVGGPLGAVAIFAVVLVILFRGSFNPVLILFSNDSPLGAAVAQYDYLLTNMRGAWQPLYWLGNELVSNRPTVSLALGLFMGPIAYAKFYALLALLILGWCSWVFFRAAGFSPAVSVIAGLATMLNSNAFSNACWGLPPWIMARAMVYLALAVLVSDRIRRPWMRVVCAGGAVGMSVMEGFDMGAIFSFYVAAFAIFMTWQRAEGGSGRRLVRASLFVGLLALFALCTAAHGIHSLVATQMKGVAAPAGPSSTETGQARWDAATQWSLPKSELLRVIIPGLYGYRMDTPDGGQYWGSVGRQPGWEKHRTGLARYSGSGEYAGVLTVLLALWGVSASLQKNRKTWTGAQRRMVWFWAIVAVISLLLAFGRHAPFYWWIYQLPFFSSVRNPIKFMQPFHVALTILFAYGLRDLLQGVGAVAAARAENLSARLGHWWRTAAPFERRWCLAWLGMLAVALFAWVLISAPGSFLDRHLQTVGFDATQAAAIQSFAGREVGWFVVLLALTVGALLLIQIGRIRSTRWDAPGWILGLLLVADLSRANLPWIQYENYQEKYARNALVDILRERPFEHRIAFGPNPGIPAMGALGQVYHANWLQHEFPYYQIQALEVPQEPRMAEAKSTYLTVMGRAPLRYWQLTNTRFLLGMAASADPQQPFDYSNWLNDQADPVERRFRAVLPFTLGYTEDSPLLVMETNRTGPFALVEFQGALPRAKLYTQWEVIPDQAAALQRLIDPGFDPESQVIVAEEPALPPGSTAAGDDGSSVEIVAYAPKEVRLRVQTSSDAVLLLNDQYHPNWRGWVNSQPAPVLRANAIVRGLALPAGSHDVVFRFAPPSPALWLSLAGLVVALGTAAWCISERAVKDRASETVGA